MTRRLTIVSVVAALGVTAAAPASAATSTAPGRVGGKMHLDDVNLGNHRQDAVDHTEGVVVALTASKFIDRRHS